MSSQRRNHRKNNAPKPPENPAKATIQQSDLTVSNEAKLDVVNPIPFEVKGDSTAFNLFEGDKKYIPFLNPNDNYFSILQEASILSPTTQACINSKVFFCSGNGIRIKDADQSKEKEFKLFQKKINNRRQSLGKLMDIIFSNRFRVGNVFIEIIRIKVGETAKVMAYVRSFLDCRLGAPDANDIPQSVLISRKFRGSKDWEIDDTNAVELPIYNGEDTKWKDFPDGSSRCMIHIKNDMDGYDYYGLPENVSTLPWQILEYNGARYNLDNFENNMVIGGAIMLQGSYTDSELTKVATNIRRQHTGSGKRGRWTVLATKQGGGTVENFSKQTDGDFLKLDENAEQKIIDSNNWDSALFGQNSSKGLGNGGNSYLRSIFKIKHKTVVEPTREVIFEEFIYPFLEINDKFCNTKWSAEEIEFVSIDIEDLIEDIEINSVITVDEGREKLNMDKLGGDRGQKLIAEITKGKNVQTEQN